MRRSTSRRGGLLRLGLAAAALATAAGLAPLTAAHADDPTVSANNFRTGWDPNEPGLSGLAPTESDFGKLWDTPLSGQIYAQPVVVDAAGATKATVVVATEADDVYGLNPSTGKVRWHTSLGTPWPPSTVDCGNINTRIGVTSTPVYDPTNGAVYVMAKTNGEKPSGAADPDHPHWKLHALSVNTGKELSGWPVTISGHPDNDPVNAFNPKNDAQRPGLLLLGGSIYAGFASYCDVGPFDGYVAGISTTSHKLTSLWATATGTPNGWGGVWQSGGGLVSDGPGRIFVATGNGNQDAPPVGPATTIPSNLSQSVVRLEVSGSGKITAQDFFSPRNNASLNADDLDLGSGGPVAIPKSVDGKQLLVQIGKDGRVFLLNRNDLGGMGTGPGETDAAVDVSGPFNGLWGHPAYWGGPGNDPSDGGYVYDVENQGPLRAFHISTDASGTPALTPVGTSSGTFGYTSGSPVITSDGAGAGSALVWVVYTQTPYGNGGELRAYDATPQGGTLTEVYSSKDDSHVSFFDEKFTTPATDGNRIFFGTADGEVLAFGESSQPAVSASPQNFGSVDVNTTSGPQTVTLTARRTATITAISTHGRFTAALPPGSLPATLTAGQTLDVPVTFSPNQVGAADGDLTVTSTGRHDHLDLFGFGSQAGLVSDPSSLDFGTVPTGSVKTINVDVVNTGTSVQTITAAALTQSDIGHHPLSVQSPVGATVDPGESLAIRVTDAPGAGSATSDSGTLTVTGDSGTPAAIPITSHAINGNAVLTLKPNPLNFGAVDIGTSSTLRFALRNTGNIPLTFSKAAAPRGQFTTSNPIPEGSTLQPGQALRQPVTFRPTTTHPRPAIYYFNFSDGTGATHPAQVETLEGTGVDAIAEYYQKLGGRHSVLGRPLHPERSVAEGRVRRYQHGRIYWSPATGAHWLAGKILSHYLVLEGPDGFAGFPTTDVRRTKDRHGHLAGFANNTVIYTRPRVGTFEVNGAILDRYRTLGGVTSRLGYPTSDEFGTAHGLRHNDFQRGEITWNPRTGKTKVHYF